MQVVDLTTRVPFQTTQIADRTYVHAEPGREFAVVATLLQPSRIRPLVANEGINASLTVNGQPVGYGMMIRDGSVVIDYIATSKGKQRMMFITPLVEDFYDVEDAKRNAEFNKTSTVGVITIKFSIFLDQKTTKICSNGALPPNVVPNTKNVVDRPNVGITAGEIISTATAEPRRNVTFKETVGTLTVYCQPPDVIAAILLNEVGSAEGRHVKRMRTEVPAVNEADEENAVVVTGRAVKKEVAVVDLTQGLARIPRDKNEVIDLT
jgi:hypothetical protein